MKIWSDVLTVADFRAALPAYCRLCRFDGPDPARMRSFRWNIRLAKWGGKHPLNPGRSGGAERDDWPAIGCASYDEWGWWLAELFSRDSNMRAGQYDGVMEFRRLTGEKFPVNGGGPLVEGMRRGQPQPPDWLPATVAANAARERAHALLRQSRDAEAAAAAAEMTVYDVVDRADALLAEHERLVAIRQRHREDSDRRLWVNALHP